MNDANERVAHDLALLRHRRTPPRPPPTSVPGPGVRQSDACGGIDNVPRSRVFSLNALQIDWWAQDLSPLVFTLAGLTLLAAGVWCCS